uniref:Uncharacterized protein n=1 Tax=Rhizophora mucronata TaxID=61149 RepID=A0A2P2N8K5_RHIMU
METPGHHCLYLEGKPAVHLSLMAKVLGAAWYPILYYFP